jgi:hypothetical protein
VALAIFIALHGVTHSFFPSYGDYDSWLLGEARGLALVLLVAGTGLFVLAGVALLVRSRWWPLVTLVASFVSLVLLLAFWETGLVVGVAIDVALIAFVFFERRRTAGVQWS